MPIDMVLTADTGMEFPEMYRHWDRVEQYLYRERGLHLTILRHPKGFEWLMFDEPKEKPSSIELRAQLGVPPYGNGWPGIKVRWCTGQMKTHLISKEVNMLKGQYSALHYVGIAADEPTRIKNEQYPLVTWGSQKKTHLISVMTGGTTGTDCMRYMAAVPAGAVHSRKLESCGICAVFTRSYGQN